MGIGAGLYMYDVVVEKFTFAIELCYGCVNVLSHSYRLIQGAANKECTHFPVTRRHFSIIKDMSSDTFKMCSSYALVSRYY